MNALLANFMEAGGMALIAYLLLQTLREQDKSQRSEFRLLLEQQTERHNSELNVINARTTAIATKLTNAIAALTNQTRAVEHALIHLETLHITDPSHIDPSI